MSSSSISAQYTTSYGKNDPYSTLNGNPLAPKSSQGNPGGVDSGTIVNSAPATPQSAQLEELLGGKALTYLKGLANTKLNTHPIGAALHHLAGVQMPFQDEGKQFRHEIGEPLADLIQQYVPIGRIQSAAGMTKAAMHTADGEWGDAVKSALGTITPKGPKLIPNVTNLIQNVDRFIHAVGVGRPAGAALITSGNSAQV